MLKFILFVLVFLSTLYAGKLTDALENGYVEGKTEFFFYNIDKKQLENTHATALGGYLAYTTDTKQLFYASMKFYASTPIFSSQNPEQTFLFNNDKSGETLYALGESYIAYKGNQRVIKLGNIILDTPLLNADYSRIVPWSYQGFAYKGYSSEHTSVQLYYIDAIRSHTSNKYSKESGSGNIGSSGITMFSFFLKDQKHFNFQAYYYYAPQLYSTLFTQATYARNLNDDTLFCFGLEYFISGNGGEYNDVESRNGGDNIDLVATNISIDTEDWTVSLNYSQNFGVSGIGKAYGGAAKVYTGSMIANGRGNYKPETWMLKIDYQLPIRSYRSDIAFHLTDTKVHDSRGKAFKAYYLHYRHFFTKEASIYIRYENMNYTEASIRNASYFRFISSYEF